MCAKLIKNQIDFYLDLHNLQRDFFGEAKTIFDLYACDNTVDQPRKGISSDCIKQICERIQPVTADEVQSIMRVWDRDFDSLISFDEF